MTESLLSVINAPTQIADLGDSANATKTATLTSDFETFLKMLTTQAENQDPLDPIDSSEYAAQLAQFSMVEQQVLTNDTLSSLVTQLNLQSTAGLASWIGMDVRSGVNPRFDGTPITIVPTFEPGAETAELVVRSPDGVEVTRSALQPDTATTTWDGKTDTGGVIPNGDYNLTVESFANGEKIGTGGVEFYGRVTEAQISGSDVRVVLSSGQSVAADAVTAIRE